MDINMLSLSGRLTKDAELKYMANDKALANFSIAVNRSKKVGDKWEDVASFFDCVLFGKVAEALHPYLVKGKKVFIGGKLQQDRWERDGKKFSKVQVIIEAINIDLGDKAQGAAPANAGQSLLNDINRLVEGSRHDLSEAFKENVSNYLRSEHSENELKKMKVRVEDEIKTVLNDEDVPF